MAQRIEIIFAKGYSRASTVKCHFVRKLSSAYARHTDTQTHRHTHYLYVPRTCRRFGDRVFAVAASRVWNSLPTDIKVHRSTTTSFKRRLKTVLFNRGFAEYM